MSRRIVAAAFVGSLIASCTDAPAQPSGLFVVLSSPDVYAGSDFDTLEIRAGSKVVNKSVTSLPTSISIVGAPGTETKVEVRALMHGVVRVAVYAKTTIPNGKFAVLPLRLEAVCRDRCVQVAPGAPIESYCSPSTPACVRETVTGIEVGTLQTYDPSRDPTATLASTDCGGNTIIDPQTCNGVDMGALACTDTSGEGSTGDLSCVSCRGVTSSSCTNANGLAAGSRWPTQGGSPLRQNRSAIVGPTSARLQAVPLDPSPIGGVLWAPVVGKDDTVWFTSEGLSAPKLDPKKRAGVVIAVTGTTVTQVFQPDGLADCHLDPTQDGGSQACRLSPPVIADDGSVYTTTNTAATFQILGAGPNQQFETLVLGVGCMNISYCNTMQLAPVFRNDATAGRLVYLPTGAGLMLLKVAANNALISSFQAPFAFNSECPSWGPRAPAIDATGTFYLPVQNVFPPYSAKLGVCAIDSRGRSKWHSPVTEGLASTPVVGNDHTIYFGGDDQFLHALDPAAPQKFKWSAATGGATTAPAIGVDGTIYVGSADANLYAFDAAGLQKWSLHTKGVIEAQPLVDGDGTIYFGTKKGLVYAVNPNGTVLWTSIAGSPISQSGVLTSNGTFYVGTDEGFVFAFPRSN